MKEWEVIMIGGRWHWCRTNDDGTINQSATGFVTLDVCAQDAQVHGCSHEQALQAKTRAVSPDTVPQKIFTYPKATRRS